MGRWDPSGLTTLDDYAYQLRTNSQPGSEEYEESFKIEEEAARRNQRVTQNVNIENKPIIGMLSITTDKGLFIPTKFTQTMFTEQNGFLKDKGFGEFYWKTACNAAAVLNIFSIQYTLETNKVLTLQEGFSILQNVCNL